MTRIFLIFCLMVLTRAYFMGPDVLSWVGGKAYCISQGTRLASIHSFAQLLEAYEACDLGDADIDDRCHIGLVYKQNQWSWTDGTPTNYGFDPDTGDPKNEDNGFPWFENVGKEPNNSDAAKNETCVAFDVGGGGPGNKPGYDDIYCDDIANEHSNNFVLCNGCLNDDHCPPTEKCCTKRNECEPIVISGPRANSVLNHFINAADHDSNATDMFGYIVLIGFIAFIGINNIFICCWCLRKKNKKATYAKCEMVDE